MASMVVASAAVKPYVAAFEEEGGQEGSFFVEYLSIGADKGLVARRLTRGELFQVGMRAASVLSARLEVGACCVHYFTDNRLEDLAFRLGAALAATVPVTVNWQADTAERVAYKATVTKARLAIVDAGADRGALPAGVEVLDAAEALSATPEERNGADATRSSVPTAEDTRIIIFTSGTTGKPKGVQLSYRAYEANRATFEDFLQARDRPIEIVATNPFHHTNSTAMTDWALRKPDARLRLLQRYTTAYWRVLGAAARGMPFDAASFSAANDAEVHTPRSDGCLVVCPLVSRHIDFLEDLCSKKPEAVPSTLLKSCAEQFAYLLGSAPVGPTTVKRLETLLNALPVVRFGSTETCLQVAGTPLALSKETRLEAFKKGWAHEWRGAPTAGYYVGRDHRPHTEVKIVKSVDPKSPDFLTQVQDGEPGQIVTKGPNLLSGYVGVDKTVVYDGWYVNLGDVGFNLGPDLYWYTRDSAMLIRGGANYAYDQINDELVAFVRTAYRLPPETFKLAVVGLKIHSEHEDSCCVALDLFDDKLPPDTDVATLKHDLSATFLAKAASKGSGVSKGAKPDLFWLTSIPTNFKGLVLLSELAAAWKLHLQA